MLAGVMQAENGNNKKILQAVTTPRKCRVKIIIKEEIAIHSEGLKLLKKKMIDFGRSDFTNYLAEILHISISSASSKINGQSDFKQKEIRILTDKFALTGDEVKLIFATGGE